MTAPLPDDWRRAVANVMLVWPLIPKDGDTGLIPCPCCKTGLVRWWRARRNGHVHFAL